MGKMFTVMEMEDVAAVSFLRGLKRTGGEMVGLNYTEDATDKTDSEKWKLVLLRPLKSDAHTAILM